MWPNQEIWEIFSRLPEPGEAGYHRALSSLCRARNLLPGVINLEIPPAELSSRDWQGIISRSSRACNCGARRWIIPTFSRGEIIPADTAPLTISPTQQLALGPKGGDRETSYTQMRIQNSSLVFRNVPHARASEMTMRLAGVARETSLTLIKVAARVAAQGSYKCFTRVLREGGGTLVVVPMGAVLAVDADSQTVSFVPDIGCSVVDRAGRGSLHEC